MKISCMLVVRAYYIPMCFCLRAFIRAKVSISLFLSKDFASTFSIERIARSSSLCWDKVDLKYVFISFNFGKDRSAVATVTGMVTKRNNLYTWGNDELTRLSSIKFIKSMTVFFSPISSLNSLAKNRSWGSKSSVKSFA